MVTDSLFYRLFETSPETFFLALGLPLDQAQATAARYQYAAIEFKETSHRSDGVFQPIEPGLPVYFVELQFYRLPAIYADILVKAYTYLKQHDPAQCFCAVVLFGIQSLEPKELAPYQPLLNAGILRRIYLDQLPITDNAPLAMSILQLIGQEPTPATESARNLLVRTQNEINDAALQESLLELIETIVVYKLPHMSREEIRTMLTINDLRHTRVFQEGREEGREEGLLEGMARGIEKGTAERLLAIGKLSARGFKAEEIADVLSLDVGLVQTALAATANKSK
jgi:predicted transposase/invertase (TIGR01784 family)